jgi:ribosomal-protein-alanine N-acetyltransferase
MKVDNYNISIRPLKLSDLPEILKIEKSSFSDPWSVDSFRSVLTSGYYINIGVFKERLIGYFIGQFIVDELHIFNIAVDPEYRRTGIAALMIDALTMVFEDKLDTIFLEVRESNIAALNFYKKLGFETVGKREKYYKDGEDALLMTLFLDRKPQKDEADRLSN